MWSSRNVTLATLLVLCAPLYGDALTDIRAALGQLAATAPVRGSFDVTTSTKSEDDSDAGRSTVAFEIVDGSLRLIYPKAMLAQSAAEARAEAVNADAKTPVRTGARSIRALHLADLLDSASYLTNALQKAKLTGVKPSPWNGKPARLVTLTLEANLAASAKKRVKKFESTLSIWIGEDNIPLAAERATLAKASILLMSIDQQSKVNWTYTRAGDRLVTTKYEETQKVDGMGQHTQTVTTEVVKLEP